LDLDERERMNRPGWPKMAFIEQRLAQDQTNWWAPNHACVEAMLRSTGMRVTARPGHEIYVCEPAPELESSMWRWNADEYRAAIGALPSRTNGA
jgi:tRNA (mo5U34)-methyltransferase